MATCYFCASNPCVDEETGASVCPNWMWCTCEICQDDEPARCAAPGCNNTARRDREHCRPCARKLREVKPCSPS